MRTLLSGLGQLGMLWTTVWLSLGVFVLWFGSLSALPTPTQVVGMFECASIGAPGAALAVLSTWLRDRYNRRDVRRGFDVLPGQWHHANAQPVELSRTAEEK